MADVALRLTGVAKAFGRTSIIQGVDLDVLAGERHAIIGPNGAGKSTLFNLISGRLALSAGDIALNGETITGMPPHLINQRGLSRSFQITNVFPKLSVFENLRCAVVCAENLAFSVFRTLSSSRRVTERCERLLEEIGLADRRDVLAEALTYAEMRALELGLTIAGDARVILLDEPLAGMNRSEGERAIALIRRISEGRTLLLVEHDMAVVFQIADRISALVYGKIIATGTPQDIRANVAVQEAYLGSTLPKKELTQ